MTPREARAQLWSQLETRAAKAGREARFTVYWHQDRSLGVEVTPIDNQLHVRVTPAMIEAANAISEPYLSGLATHHAGRPFVERAANDLRENLGKTVSLNTYAVAVRVPTYLPTRSTVTISVYRHFSVDPGDLSGLLDDPQTKALTALQTDKKRQLLLLAEVVTALMGVESEDEEDEVETAVRPWASNRNVIFFGPPGTGKSFLLASLVEKHLAAPESHVLRVTFHPEYSYYDFIGSYRPSVGWLKTTSGFRGADGKERNEEPRTYYRFDPGPLSTALKLAAKTPDLPTVLVIEEINRGNCAAIFGEVFQLLDRILDKDRAAKHGVPLGSSEYAIHPSSEWAAWLASELPDENQVFKHEPPTLRLPPNLYLYATMNTSDQSLFPMDTAFRRRWGMEFVGIGRSNDEKVKVPLHGRDVIGVPWVRLMRLLNEQIVQHTRSDDKQVGPFFVRPLSSTQMVGAEEFCSKVIFYLWADVFRDQPAVVFLPKYSTYEEVVDGFKAGNHVFRTEITAAVGVATPALMTTELVPGDVGEDPEAGK